MLSMRRADTDVTDLNQVMARVMALHSPDAFFAEQVDQKNILHTISAAVGTLATLTGTRCVSLKSRLQDPWS